MLLLFIIIILLNITLLLKANEKMIEPFGNNSMVGDSIVSFNFNNNFNNIVKYGDGDINYTKKRRGMLALGGVGVGLFVSGFLMETGGTIAFLIILLVREPAFESIAESRGYDAVPVDWYMDKYIALIIASAGSLVFLAGLGMAIPGFILARYYKNKASKVTLGTFNECDNNLLKTGFVLKF